MFDDIYIYVNTRMDRCTAVRVIALFAVFLICLYRGLHVHGRLVVRQNRNFYCIKKMN